jgi:hypothetical protein
MNLFLKVPHTDPLKCTHCGFDYLHIQKAVIIDGEDNYQTNRILTVNDLDNFSVEEAVLPTGNRVRELSLKAVFKCEECENEREYTIASHKGQVYCG